MTKLKAIKNEIDRVSSEIAALMEILFKLRAERDKELDAFTAKRVAAFARRVADAR